jgi:hypothetical protein
VSQCGLAKFTLKSILKQKKNYENSSISPSENITNLQKNPLKETKIFQDIIITTTNLKVEHKPKVSSFKNLHVKIDLLPREMEKVCLEVWYLS